MTTVALGPATTTIITRAVHVSRSEILLSFGFVDEEGRLNLTNVAKECAKKATLGARSLAWYRSFGAGKS